MSPIHSKLKFVFHVSAIACFIAFISITATAQSQKWGYAYTVNTSTKSLYITESVDLNTFYNKCRLENTYGGGYMSIGDCFSKNYFESLKIESGSDCQQCDSHVIYCKSKYDNNIDYYTDLDQVKQEIKKIKASYRGDGYSMIIINP